MGLLGVEPMGAEIMREEREAGFGAVSAFFQSALYGGMLGSFLLLVSAFIDELRASLNSGGDPFSVFALFVIFSVPVCGVGLFMFGLPVTWLLRSQWQAPLVGVVVVCCGSAAGGLVWITPFCHVFWGYAWTAWDAFMLGGVYGASTAFWWWFLYRRVLIRREAASTEVVPET